jgi:hypothetical protein
MNNFIYGVISANFGFYLNNYFNKIFLKFKLSSRSKIILISPFTFTFYYLFMGISENRPIDTIQSKILNDSIFLYLARLPADYIKFFKIPLYY